MSRLQDILNELQSGFAGMSDVVDDLTASLKKEFADRKANTAQMQAQKRQQQQIQAAEKKKLDQQRELAEGFAKFNHAVNAAGIAMTGIVAAGNPTAFRTLTDSVRLVATELSNFLAPTVLAVAGAAQELAQWLSELSPEAKETITKFAGITAAGAFVAKGMGLLLSPMVLLTAAVAAAAAVMWEFVTAEEKALNRYKGISDRADVKSRAELESSDIYKKIKGTEGKDERQKIVDAEQFRLNQERRQVEEKLHGLMDNSSVYTRWRDKDKIAGGEAELERIQKQQRLLSASRNELLLGEQFTPKPKPEGGPGDKEPKGGPPKMHWFKELESKFSTIEEARKQFQLQALKDPLEAETLKVQRRAAEVYLAEVPKENNWREWVRSQFGPKPTR